MKRFNLRKRSSGMALAIALATGSAVVATAVYPAEAHAQRKKKKDAEKEASGYSKEFVAAYQPIDEGLKAEGADASAFIPQLRALVPLAKTPDEKNAAGGMIYNAAISSGDRSLQLTGMELLLASGKIDPAQIGRYNFIAYQLSNNEKQYEKARTYLLRALENNFSTPELTTSALELAVAEVYFVEGRHADGLDYLNGKIAARKAQGLPVDEQWYRRGLTEAYNNAITPQVYDIATNWVADFPAPANWRDAVNLTRNLNNFQPPAILDLLRLSRAAGSLKDKQDYILYIESADARRLPKEVKDVIDAGYASGNLPRDDSYIAEALSTANGRIQSDRSDLPALERDADAAGAQLRTVMAAAGAFYSYGEYAKAAKFYEKALGMPGVDTGEALTRLGMAQVGNGDFASAQATFAKVDGERAPIAKLWAAYAASRSTAS